MAQRWISGGGDAGALMRGLDWSRSPLGPPESWPHSLRSVVGLLLGSKFPMFVAWGEDLGFLYNDAYAEILGEKHPAAMGARFHDIWSEIWSDILPLIQAALAGQAIYREDLPLLMNRRGFDEQTWFTFSYSPVRGDDGQVAGMFCAVVETTERVRGEQRQAFLFDLDERLRDVNDAGEIMAASAERLGRHLGADRAHWALVDEPADHFEVVQEWDAPGAPGLLGGHRLSGFGEAMISQMRAGRSIAVCDVRDQGGAAGDPLDEPLRAAIRAGLSVPLFRGGVWQAALCVHALQPRWWRDDETELAREVAERVWARVQRAQAEAQVRQSESRLRALLNATSDVIYRMSPDWTELRQLDGRGFLADAQGPSADWIPDYLFPEDQPAVRAAIAEAIRTRGVYQLEHRVRRLDGSEGWTHSRAVPVLDEAGAILEWFGAASDITEQRRAQDALEKSAELLRLATDAAEVGFWDVDMLTQAITWPPRVKAMFGLPPDQPVTLPEFFERLHPQDRDRVAEAFAAAADPAQRAVYDVEYRSIGKTDGVIRWIAAKGRGIFDDQGCCVRVVGTAIDVSVRKTAEQHLRLMVNELNHRVKNSLATVQAIANQTLRRGEIPAEVRDALASRLVALAAAHDVLTDERWSGANLTDVIAQAAAPYMSLAGVSPFVIQGPPVFLPPRTAIAMALAFHELATNAAKYGALSQPGGQVTVAWSQSPLGEARRLHLTWTEDNGPPVRPPTRSGFGSRLIERALAAELQGAVVLEYRPQGLVCTMDARLPEERPDAWMIDLQLT